MRPPPPALIDLGDVRLRHYSPDDIPALAAAVRASYDHLHPWMAWATPEGTSPEAVAQFVEGVAARPAAQGDTVYAVVAPDGAVLGGCGLHDRLGPGGIEIGYWLHVDATGRGLMTRIAAHLTDLALAMDDIDRVEIHCDEANVRSAAVPRRLGYRLEAVVDSQRPRAPADSGRDMVWVRTEPIGPLPR